MSHWLEIPGDFNHINNGQLQSCFVHVLNILQENGDFSGTDIDDIWDEADNEDMMSPGTGLNVIWGWICSVITPADAIQYALQHYANHRGHRGGGRSKKKRSKKKRSKKKRSKKKRSKKRRSRKY